MDNNEQLPEQRQAEKSNDNKNGLLIKAGHFILMYSIINTDSLRQ